MKFSARPIVFGLSTICLLLLLWAVNRPQPATPTTSRGPAGQTTAEVVTGTPVTETAIPLSSPALRDLPPSTNTPSLQREVNRRSSLGEMFGRPPTNWRDPLAASGYNPSTAAPTPILSFDGLNAIQGNGAAPPDTIGAVGVDYFVQMVNVTTVGIYNKSDGSIANPPVGLNSLWSATGDTGACSNNTGDPVVEYDQLAGRWILAQFTFSNDICIAVSQTGDPLGAYHLYQYTFPTFPDYYKIGVWPDGYYITANQLDNNIHAVDRQKMLNGEAAGIISFAVSRVNNHAILLPSSAEGSVPPPAGTPNILYRFIEDQTGGGIDRLQLYEFSADFDTPGNSTLTGPVNLPVSAFDLLCNDAGFIINDCIRQPETNQGLDSISEWPMWRFVYRNQNTYEVLLATHAVDLGGDQAGLRWYELRRTAVDQPWAIHQEGTYAPDEHSRWMSSIGMDGEGNIALAYNVTSSSLYPSLRYAVRTADDPAGTLGKEATLVDGTGYQTLTNRWGDYSALTLDPTDDCTFWFTGEYYTNSGGASWRTRIGSFKMPNCPPTDPPLQADLHLTKDAGGPAVINQPLTYTINLTGTAVLTNPLVVDALPAGLDYVSADGPGWSCSHLTGTITCTRSVLDTAVVAPISLTAVPTVFTPLTNTVTATADNAAQTVQATAMVDAPESTATLTAPAVITVSAGTPYTIPLTITNTSPHTDTFVLSTPLTWTHSFTPSSVVQAPGETAVVSLSITPPPTAADRATYAAVGSRLMDAEVTRASFELVIAAEEPPVGLTLYMPFIRR